MRIYSLAGLGVVALLVAGLAIAGDGAKKSKGNCKGNVSAASDNQFVAYQEGDKDKGKGRGKDRGKDRGKRGTFRPGGFAGRGPGSTSPSMLLSPFMA